MKIEKMEDLGLIKKSDDDVKSLSCPSCNFTETLEDESNSLFIGIFSPGTPFYTTENDNLCGLYACPNCKTVQMVMDTKYIRRRKEIYKKQKKGMV